MGALKLMAAECGISSSKPLTGAPLPIFLARSMSMRKVVFFVFFVVAIALPASSDIVAPMAAGWELRPEHCGNLGGSCILDEPPS